MKNANFEHSIAHKMKQALAHYREGQDGRWFQLASSSLREPRYEYKGFERNWRFTLQNMLALEADGRVWHESGKLPRRMEESKGDWFKTMG